MWCRCLVSLWILVVLLHSCKAIIALFVTIALSFTSETVNILIAGLVSIKASAVPYTTVCSWWGFSFRSAWYDHVFVQAIFLVLAWLTFTAMCSLWGCVVSLSCFVRGHHGFTLRLFFSVSNGPKCLGIFHLREDVDNPCSTACNMPMEEWLCPATRVCSSVSDHGRESECIPDRSGQKCSCKHSHDYHHNSPYRWSHEEVLETTKCFDTQLQIFHIPLFHQQRVAA